MAEPRAITRLLIANRGEIAVRIARTAHRLGIETIGVYSEPDKSALHVDVVDRAVALGGSTPAESYLRADAVLRAAVDAGCDAVHPGYGFLAENAPFARSVVDAGLIWVGPTPGQISLLGDKIAAKQAAVEAGVPTTAVVTVEPGKTPAGVSFPVLVKAAAGGGGRGMRVVREPDDLPGAVEAASREAASAFGDGTVFIEPYIEHGRHVEVQILGDSHGNVVHLGERECSIQRRNQKVVEEAPSAGISDETRTTLLEASVALARHVGYQNAGTIEFLVGPDVDDQPGAITFLEVNTRLQVEHPVTEAVTGLDLVELQLRVAAGEPLPMAQDDVGFTGHAIEVRLVAEDPAAGWLPDIGDVRGFHIDDAVRVDSGVRRGSVVTADYDSLIAKVIAHAPTRVEAVQRLRRALRRACVAGVTTDLHALVALLGEDDFLAAATPTSYLDDHPEVAACRGPGGDDRVALLLGAVFTLEARRRTADRVTGFAPSGWRNVRVHGQRQVWTRGDEAHHVEYVLAPGSERRSRTAEVKLGPWPTPTEDGSLGPDDRRAVMVRLLGRSADEQALEIDGVRHVVRVDIVDERGPASRRPADEAVVVDTWSGAGALSWELAPRFEDHDVAELGGGPTSPLPGTVIAVHVEAGEEVTAGAVLMVVEAMKMEHTITAGADAVVTDVRFAVGDRVDAGDLLVALRSADRDGSDDD